MKRLNKILLVDDDPVNNFLNKKILQDLNIAQEIKVLTNGKLALDHILENCATAEKTCPSLVILDHHMPVMDGLQMMKALHSSGMLERIKVVFLLLAIQTTPEDKVVFQKLGVQEFTSKPLSRQTVMNAYNKYWAND